MLSPLGGGIDFVVVTSSRPGLGRIANARQIISEYCAGSTDPVFPSAARIAVRVIIKCLNKVSCMVSPLYAFLFFLFQQVLYFDIMSLLDMYTVCVYTFEGNQKLELQSVLLH